MSPARECPTRTACVVVDVLLDDEVVGIDGRVGGLRASWRWFKPTPTSITESQNQEKLDDRFSSSPKLIRIALKNTPRIFSDTALSSELA